MNLVNCSKNKMLSIVLVVSVLMATAISTVKFFGRRELLSACNNVLVHKIDDSSAHIYSNAIKMSSSDFLFCKSKNSNGTFQYDICGLDSKDRLYSFSSPMDIVINDGLSSNSQLGAGVWALASGATGASALGAVGSICSGVAAAGKIGAAATGVAATVGAAASSGAASAAAGLGFMAGAKLGGAVLLTAVGGPAVILAGAGALATLG